MNNIRQQIHELPPAARENIIMRAIVPGIRKGLTFDLADHEIIDWLLDIVEDAHDHILRTRSTNPIAPSAQAEPAQYRASSQGGVSELRIAPSVQAETAQYCIVRRLDDAPEDTENRWLWRVFPVKWVSRSHALVSPDKAQLEEIANHCNGIVVPFNDDGGQRP